MTPSWRISNNERTGFRSPANAFEAVIAIATNHRSASLTRVPISLGLSNTKWRSAARRLAAVRRICAGGACGALADYGALKSHGPREGNFTRGRSPELRTLSVPLALNPGRALLAQRPSRQAAKSWGKFRSMGVGRGVDCGRAVHLDEARGAITARHVAQTLIVDRIVAAGGTIIDARQ